MDDLIRDLRFAWTQLVKRPAATTVAVASLALGIGANVAVFSFASAVLYRPLPVADPDTLVRIFTTDVAGAELEHSSYADYLDLRDQRAAFGGVAAYFYFPMGFSVDESPEVVLGQLVSANYFEVMGVSPSPGRGFRPEEDRLPEGDAVAVVSHRLWVRRLHADPGVLGRSVLVNNRPFTVIGVAPEGFTAPNVILTPDVWVPVTTARTTFPYPVSLEDRNESWLLLAGRLRDGQSLAGAQDATDAVAARLAEAYPGTNRDRRFRLIEANRARVGLKDTTDLQGRAMLLLLAVVGAVLLVACLNVANLNLAAAIDRRKEIALRHSLGASMGRLLRQLMTESLLVAAIAGICGLIVAVWTIDLLLALVPDVAEFPLEIDARLDWRTTGFGVLLTFGSTLAFGLAPAWQAVRHGQYDALRDSGRLFGLARGVFTAQRALVVAQVALSFVLLAGGGLFLRSLTNTLAIDPGFDPEHGVLVPIDLGFGQYDEARGRPFVQQILDRVEALPGVESAAVSIDLPLGQLHMRQQFGIDGRDFGDPDGLFLRSDLVGPRYFETLGIPIARGRAIDARDRPGSTRAAVVNETMAQRFWPGEDPIGRTFQSNDVTWTIVGVARDGKYDRLDEPPQPFFWLSLGQAGWLPRFNLHARTRGDAEALVQPVARAVQALDPNLPVQRAMTTRQFFQTAIQDTAGPGRLLAGIGLLALVLALVGTYGLMSFVASRRRQDFGVRLALGADARRLSRHVLADGLRLGLTGAAVGLGLSALASRAIGRMLFGVHPLDPFVLVSVAAILVVATVAACYVPSRAAGRADPVVALRAE